MNNSTNFVIYHKCGVEFASTDYLQNHIETNHQKIKKFCKICGKVFKHSKHYIRHKKECHQKLIHFHNCTHCNKKFTRYSNYVRHLYTHNEKNKACFKCGKLFHRNDVLKRHLETHVNIKSL